MKGLNNYFYKLMENIVKAILTTIVFILLAVNCKPQSADFIIDWDVVNSADYYLVFIWEGSDPLACPLQSGATTLTSEIMALQVDSVTTLVYVQPIILSGELIRGAIVAFNSVDQSPMGVTTFHQKPIELSTPVVRGRIE